MSVVKGDQKAPFLIATTSRCRGRYSFPWIDSFILDLFRIMPNVRQGGIYYHWEVGSVFANGSSDQGSIPESYQRR